MTEYVNSEYVIPSHDKRSFARVNKFQNIRGFNGG